MQQGIYSLDKASVSTKAKCAEDAHEERNSLSRSSGGEIEEKIYIHILTNAHQIVPLR